MMASATQRALTARRKPSRLSASKAAISTLLVSWDESSPAPAILPAASAAWTWAIGFPFEAWVLRRSLGDVRRRPDKILI